jgi:hypothetical protein
LRRRLDSAFLCPLLNSKGFIPTKNPPTPAILPELASANQGFMTEVRRVKHLKGVRKVQDRIGRRSRATGLPAQAGINPRSSFEFKRRCEAGRSRKGEPVPFREGSEDQKYARSHLDKRRRICFTQ